MAGRAHSAALLAVFLAVGYTQSITNVPIVVAPSGQWSGPDGPWSTFNLGVGAPFQAFQGVPGLTSAIFMLPAANEACNETTCPGREFFNVTNSASWTDAGLYEIPFPLFYTDNLLNGSNTGLRGSWGVDNVYLGNSARDTSSEIYVATLLNRDFVVASFGLMAGEVGGLGETKTTLLSRLRQQGEIPSSSVSYTAGSVQRNSSGSLILGGYDTSRFDSSTTIMLPMPSKQSTSLVVNVDSINFSGGSEQVWRPKGNAGTSFNIDSTITQIWLPDEACKAFEDAFGIVWNDTAKLYLLDDITREKLRQSNAVVNITIRENEQRSVTFTLPYTAFDLTVTKPLVEGAPSRYFPLKRANTSSEYVLGRVFLQETYISIDYDRAHFNLSQAYPEGGSSRVMTISPPSNNTDNIVSNTTDTASSSLADTESLSTREIVAITISTIVVSLVGVCVLIAWRKRWGFFGRKATEHEEQRVEKAEMDGESKPWVEAMSNERAEIETAERSQEVPGLGRPPVELEGSSAYHEVSAGFVVR